MTGPRIFVFIALLTCGAFCVPVSRIGDSWGTNIHWTSETQPGEAAMLSRAFKVARMDLTWTRVESTCGEYDFSSYDVLLSTMQAHGIRPYWILDYSNPCYPGTLPSACDTTECIQGYGRFAAAVANHFKGNHIVFESVNEPNGMGSDNATDIVALCAAAWPGFHSVGEMWVGPATSGFAKSYVTSAFQNGLLSYLSAVSVHPYRPTAPETAISDFEWLFSEIESFSPSKQFPVFDGEWGYTSASLPCNYGNRVDEITQGKYLARMWLTSTLAGTSMSIAYDWHDDGTNPTVCEDNFGSVYANATGNISQPFTPKPSYVAAVTLQNGIGNTEKFVRRVVPSFIDGGQHHPRDIFIAEFSCVNGPMYAVWHNMTNSTITVNVEFQGPRAGSPCWALVGTFGEHIDNLVCPSASGAVKVPVSNGPAYLLHGPPKEKKNLLEAKKDSRQ